MIYVLLIILVSVWVMIALEVKDMLADEGDDASDEKKRADELADSKLAAARVQGQVDTSQATIDALKEANRQLASMLDAARLKGEVEELRAELRECRNHVIPVYPTGDRRG